MTPKERQELLKAIVGHIIDVTEDTDEYLEDTDTSILENVPMAGRVRRYRLNKDWLKE